MILFICAILSSCASGKDLRILEPGAREYKGKFYPELGLEKYIGGYKLDLITMNVVCLFYATDKAI